MEICQKRFSSLILQRYQMESGLVKTVYLVKQIH